MCSNLIIKNGEIALCVQKPCSSLSSQYNQLIADESQSVEISLIFVSMILRLIRTCMRSILVYPTNFSFKWILDNSKKSSLLVHVWYWLLCFTITLLLHIVRLHKVQCFRYEPLECNTCFNAFARGPLVDVYLKWK